MASSPSVVILTLRQAQEKGGYRALLAAVAIAAMVQPAAARELALAQGTIAMHEAPAGTRSPACGELVVEARDALDNHLIGRTQPGLATDGTCRYALSVPAQSAVWLRLRPALVADARVDATSTGGTYVPAPPADHRASSRSVQLRFTIISPNTYFFTPGEQKTVPLSY
jgi:hypothetical protein